MLRFLSIDNFALIEHLEVEFRSGLNLITGETGSGKSILVDAVGLLVGDRASLEMVRQGSDVARVEGIFEVPPSNGLQEILTEAGVPCEGSDLVIRREISRSGSNRVFINGSLSPLSLLTRLGGSLVDIHGQHAQQALLHPANHLDFLDAFGGNGTVIAELGAAYSSLRAIEQQLQALRSSERERLQREDLLRYQVEEIEKLGLKPGCDAELEAERSLLASAEKRLEASQQVQDLLYEREECVLSLLDFAQKRLEELARLDPALEALPGQMAEVRFQVEELAYQARDYSSDVEADPNRLEQLEELLDEIEKIKRKYGPSLEDVLRYYEEASNELLQLEDREGEIGRLTKRLEGARKEYIEKARALSEKRASDSSRLADAVQAELADLAMKNTIFRVHLERNEDEPSGKGIDHAEMLISPNRGEDPKPLVKIASGGEISRVMLALKSVLKSDRGPKTLVFDEVDAGIGGRTASSLGQKLNRIAATHQVFCVTHLPQIAAFAREHFHIGKVESNNRTVVQITPLDEDARIEELARMMAGETVSETTLRQAREMRLASGSPYAS